MSKKSEIDYEVKATYLDVMQNNKLTPTAVERSVVIYRKVAEIIQRYQLLVNDPEAGKSYAAKMDQEIVLTMAAELDRNFYEGMMENSMRNTINLMKIPQVKVIADEQQKNLMSKLDNPDQPSAEHTLDTFIKQVIGDTSPNTKANKDQDVFKNTVNSSIKKEDLN